MNNNFVMCWFFGKTNTGRNYYYSPHTYGDIMDFFLLSLKEKSLPFDRAEGGGGGVVV